MSIASTGLSKHERGSATATQNDDTLDVLIGAIAIARYLNIDVRRCYHMMERGHLPVIKMGDLWTTTKSRLRRHFEGE